MATMEQRLEQLERQNRRMKITGGVTLAVIAALVALACATPSPKILEVEGLIVKDPEGKKLASLGAEKNTPWLTFFSDSEKPLTMLGVGNNSPLLAFFDENEKQRIVLGHFKVDAFGKIKSNSTFGLFDSEGKEKARFSLDERGAALTFGAESETENPTIVLRSTEDGNALAFRGKDGTAAMFGIIEGDPSLILMDDDFNTLFEAPEQK